MVSCFSSICDVYRHSCCSIIEYFNVRDMITSLHRLGIVEDDSYVEYQRNTLLQYLDTKSDIKVFNRNTIDNFYSIVLKKEKIQFVILDGKTLSPYSPYLITHVLQNHFKDVPVMIWIFVDYLSGDIDVENVYKLIQMYNNIYDNMTYSSTSSKHILHIVNKTSIHHIPSFQNHIVTLDGYYQGPICDKFDIVYTN